MKDAQELMPRTDQELSPRVLAAIKHTQAGSEILLSWMQVGFLTFMTFLYFIAPKGFNTEVRFEPVPIMLALYAPLVLLRLGLTLKERLTPCILTASVLVDIAFVLGLIFAFHLQYEQPTAFSLKAPTFCYLFIFIALRSLRYETRYLLTAGIAAIGGWGVLVLLAIWDHGIITRTYPEYISGMKILIGAEVDKMLSLLVVTIILSIGVTRARRMLSKSEAEALAKKELARFFSPDVAHKIIYSNERIRPGQGELCHAVSLMTDLRGFTTLAKTSTPHQVMQLLADYQARMVPRILEHAGCIDKFLGDGILAHFGAAVASATYAADALYAAEALARTALRWQEERRQHGLPPVRMGVACAAGELIFGAVGDEERLEFTIVGDAVNLTAKLEKHTKMAKVNILTTEALFRLALQQGYKSHFTTVYLPQEPVEGVGTPVDLVGLTSA